MNKAHLTTAPRLAMRRNEAGELVPSINTVTNEQDVNVAGTLLSIKPEPITYTREDGTEGIAYQGTSAIADEKGNETVVSVLINGSAIANVQVGQTYWLTERISKDGQYTNYSQGDLLVMNAVSADVAKNRRASLLKAQGNGGATIPLNGATVSEDDMRTALVESGEFTAKAVAKMDLATVKTNYEALPVE